ncbi:MAG: hypothetical protein ABIH70_07820 [Chloroflexota bacterium]
MAWWQALPGLWQSILIVLAFIAVGVLIGLLIGYVILPFLQTSNSPKRDRDTMAKRPAKPAAQVHDPLAASMKKHYETIATEAGFKSAAQKYAESIPKYEKAAVAEAPVRPKAPAVLLEIESNLATAAHPRTDPLLPFQIDALDTHPGEFELLPAEVREEIRQAYVDMRLANDIVWLVREVGRRSQELDEGYIKLCTRITARLDKVMPALKATK